MEKQKAKSNTTFVYSKKDGGEVVSNRRAKELLATGQYFDHPNCGEEKKEVDRFSKPLDTLDRVELLEIIGERLMEDPAKFEDNTKAELIKHIEKKKDYVSAGIDTTNLELTEESINEMDRPLLFEACSALGIPMQFGSNPNELLREKLIEHTKEKK